MKNVKAKMKAKSAKVDKVAKNVKSVANALYTSLLMRLTTNTFSVSHATQRKDEILGILKDTIYL